MSRIKKQASGRYRVRVTRNLPDGRRIERDRLCQTRSEARAVERELERELDEAINGKGRLTLTDYALQWIERRTPDLKNSTLEKYLTDLELHILPALGDRYLDDLRPSDVATYLAKDQGSVHNRRNRLALLRQLARDSEADGYASVDWVARVRAPKVPKRAADEHANILSPEELDRFLDVLPDYWRCVVWLLALTGLRWGEVSGLTWDRVDFNQRVVRVRCTNWKGKIQDPKTDEAWRVVALPDPLPAMLMEHRQRQIATQHPGLRKGWVFPTQRGTLHKGTPLRAVLTKTCKKAGVPRITTHGLRRSLNDLGRRHINAITLRKIIGHTSQEMTELYSHINVQELHEAAATLAGLILRNKKSD